ncbi:undecaprenyl-phosphate glucose phosphotransferase [Muricoccus radiodurans]|uniref:undecaprenyl-phosphate glucose phosphotransferase n=1 Tax=Muricoccus radiodurans TaxID=2231721 RepID=UPI003CF0929E
MRWHSGLLDSLVRWGDATLCALCVLVAHALVPSRLLPSTAAVVAAMVLLPALWVVVLRQFEIYALRRYRRPESTMLDTTAVAIVGGLLLLLGVEVIDHPDWNDRALIGTWVGLLVASTLASRLALRPIVKAGLASGRLRRQVAIIGATHIAETVIENLTRDDEPRPVHIVGIYDDRAGTRVQPNILGHALRGNVADLCHTAQEQRIDLIVIALPWHRAVQIFSTIERVQWIAADVTVPLDPDTFNPRSARIASVGGAPALEVMHQPLQGSGFITKTIEDYLVALVALMLLAPVMAVAALAVRLDSPGPILFRQRREGFNGKPFTILKFRTMTVDPRDQGVVGVRKGDARITRVGRILRRYSVDELPQFINVLRGEMSVVGPRPYVLGMQVENEKFKTAVRDYAARYRMKPGLTGWAQINGARGRMYSLEKARRGIEMDLHYIENWSIWFDIRIILRTLFVCLSGREAH